MKDLIKSLPFIGPVLRNIYYKFSKSATSFSSSKEYWDERYKTGGNSGAGSYDNLAAFKANVLNEFVETNGIRTVLEYGCGDGNQLLLAKYPSYIGFDVSSEAVKLCTAMFASDDKKKFKLLDEYVDESAELTLSLDVIYHLVEDDVYQTYMKRLFGTSTRFVIIYSSNTNENSSDVAIHVRHRKFSDWIETLPEWKLIKHVPNKYPTKNQGCHGKSFADFYIYEKTHTYL